MKEYMYFQLEMLIMTPFVKGRQTDFVSAVLNKISKMYSIYGF